MPTYTFRCETCGVVFDKFLSFHDDQSRVTCPNGHTTVYRVFRPPAVVFKGSGFYVTDNRGSNSAGKPAASKAETKGDGEGKSSSAKETSTAASKASSNGGAAKSD
ncbi:MAG: hypothetical protein GXO37_01280 [Chloroflexi bacterium]|nr:hypothetical protein [Chloroflexota bacterium]